MRSSLWFSCYLLTGSAIVAQYAREAYTRAADVCEMYPHFPFGETLREELWDHTTLLPIVHRPVATLSLLTVYALAFVVMHFNLLELAWLLLAEMLSGRWIHHALFVAIPSYLPFLAAEPGVPELLSDGDDEYDDAAFREEFGEYDSGPLPVNASECHRALEKLVQVKLQFADREIARPDDWLVFDPAEEELVLQREKKEKQPQKRRAEQVDPALANGSGAQANGGGNGAVRGHELLAEKKRGPQAERTGSEATDGTTGVRRR